MQTLSALAADVLTRLYFQPAPGFNGSIPTAITFCAWDQTSGANGISASSTPGGGGTAFSTATDTASLTVTDINDAPVLDPTKIPALAAVNEDAPAPTGAVGTLVSSLVDFASPAGEVDNVTDPDAGALLGIAVTAVDATNGTWFFSINGGGAWTPLGTPSTASSRLLAADATTRLYFRPNVDFNGVIASAITFCAWDQTSGSNGGTAASTPAGVNTAFSTATDTASVSITAVNDAPVVVTSGGNAAYNENSAPVAIDAAISATDVDNGTMAGAVIDFTSGFTAGQDVLGFVNQNGIGGSYDAGTGVLMLSGSASLANYIAALQSITYSNSSDDPSTALRTLRFTLDDGGLTGSAQKNLIVSASDDATVVMTSAGTTAYAEGGPAVVIDAGVTASDPDNVNLTGASVSITANFVGAEDVLGFVDQNGIAGNYDSQTGVLNLTGTATVAFYQTALQSVTYSNSSANPSTAARTMSFIAGNSPAATKVVTIGTVDDSPIATSPPVFLAYTENDPPRIINSQITLSDVDSPNLVSGTVRFFNPIGAEDVLAFTNQNNITGTYDAGTGVLNLTGSATVALWQDALRSVTFQNTSDNPNTTQRLVMFSVNDGNSSSAPALAFISVTAVNDAPVVGGTAGLASYTENAAPLTIDAGLTVSDVDNVNLNTATISIISGFAAAEDTLNFTNTATITGSYNPGSGLLTLTGLDTVANYQAAPAFNYL